MYHLFRGWYLQVPHVFYLLVSTKKVHLNSINTTAHILICKHKPKFITTFSCSSKCCKKHRQSGCEVLQKDEPAAGSVQPKETMTLPQEIPSGRLELLSKFNTLHDLPIFLIIFYRKQ